MATVGVQCFVMTARASGSARLELDTHADTCVAGSNTVVLDLTGKTVNVTPFCETAYESMKEIPIATVATAYDCPFTGKVYVLVLNEVLYFGDKMTHTLLCPNQLRANGLILDDCPTQFNENSSHSIYIPSCDLRIPLELDGVISGVVTRQPTMAELDDLSLHVELTSDLEWDPYSPDFASVEEHVQGKGKGTRSILSARVEHIQLGLSAQRMIEVETVENDDLAIRLISAVKLFGPQRNGGEQKMEEIMTW